MKNLLLLFTFFLSNLSLFCQIQKGEYYYTKQVDTIVYDSTYSVQLIHKYEFNFNSDSINLEISSFYVSPKGDTTRSPADGGYFLYKGVISKKTKSNCEMTFKLVSCKYCIRKLAQSRVYGLDTYDKSYYVIEKKSKQKHLLHVKRM